MNWAKCNGNKYTVIPRALMLRNNFVDYVQKKCQNLGVVIFFPGIILGKSRLIVTGCVVTDDAPSNTLLLGTTTSMLSREIDY